MSTSVGAGTGPLRMSMSPGSTFGSPTQLPRRVSFMSPLKHQSPAMNPLKHHSPGAATSVNHPSESSTTDSPGLLSAQGVERRVKFWEERAKSLVIVGSNGGQTVLSSSTESLPRRRSLATLRGMPATPLAPATAEKAAIGSSLVTPSRQQMSTPVWKQNARAMGLSMDTPPTKLRPLEYEWPLSPSPDMDTATAPTQVQFAARCNLYCAQTHNLTTSALRFRRNDAGCALLLAIMWIVA